MKRFCLSLLAVLAVLLSARADSPVVFNEIMYHPLATNEAALEWIELQNQLSVDMDLSGWRLDQAVHFMFPEGTVIPGGGYLVIAASPSTLAALGVTNALGPFVGRLGHNGDTVQLKNNNHRLMDELTYATEGDWPVAPDGAGPSLARRARNLATANAANWRASEQMGGTPGAENFPAVAPTVLTNFPTYPQAVLDSGPVAYWRLGETNGTAADAASAPTVPQSGAQNGVFSKFLGANLAQPGPRGTDLVNSRPLIGFEGDNTAPRFAGNNDGGDDVVLVPDPGVFGFELQSTETLPTTAETGLTINEFSSCTNLDFWLELINTGSTSADLTGCVLVRFGGATNREYLLPPQTLAPGGLLQITRAEMGFGADPGDRLVLYALDRRHVLDALVAKREPRARWPDGTGRWLFPATLTPGASNHFVFHDELVINEIMFHHRELPAVPAVVTNELLLAITNAWRYRADAVDLGEAWRAPGYNDSTWATSNALFYNTPAALAAPKNTLLRLTNAAGARVVTFYFRAQFNFTGSTNGLVLLLRPFVDDGAVFYLNGAEAARVNLPVTNILWGTLALTNVGVPNYMPTVNLPITNLLQGMNTLAVELHQVVPNSSDVAFGAELTASGELSPALPWRDAPESWVEIFNRSTNAVDLTGWQLDGGINYSFPTNKVIRPGGFLVVAKDVPYLQSLYSGLDVLGPFENKLSKSSDFISLKDPAHNPANEVRYFNGGRWPKYADGGGSSLELRDPHADNTAGEAWAASDESGKSSWQTYRWRGISAPGQAGEPTLWNEFALCLVDGAGEVLLDDISVIETPGGTPRQLIQNGSFNAGSSAHWRFLGTHRHSRVEAEPGNPGNSVLHLIATGNGEYQGNQIETTLTNHTAIVDGREYEISFRAKWLAGRSLLNSRLYFNRLARTVQLAVPALNGTPGAVNSRHLANIGPTFSNLCHFPVVPESSQPVTVSVEASDPDGVAAATLFYSVNGGAWQNLPMGTDLSLRSHHASATIPGQPASSLIQFYIAATDTLGATSAFPAGGTNSRALYVVQDGQALAGPPRNLRVIMTPAEATWLLTGTNTLSNDLLGGTVVDGEQEAFYDAGVRLKGSFVGRNVSYVGFDLYFPPHQLFHGIHDKVAVDRGVGGELLAKQIMNHAGGIPSTYDDVAQFIGPLPSYTGRAQLRLAAFDAAYLNSQFAHGSDGAMYEFEVLRYATATADGTPESPKLVGTPSGPSGYVNFDLQAWGDDAESYRWNDLLVNRREADDFAPAIAVGKLFSLTGASLTTAAPGVIDVDEWLRTMACQSLVGPADTYFTGANHHNFRLYARPEDGRLLYLPWDWDSAFWASTSASLFGGGNVTGLFSDVANTRAFLGHIYDLLTTSFNTEYLAHGAANLGALLQADQSAYLDYVTARRNYALGQLPLATAFALTNCGGANGTVSNAWLALSGSAPISVSQIEVNGTAYSATWTSLTNWTITIPLDSGANALAVRGLGPRGVSVTNPAVSIVLTNTGPGALLPVVVNEWMADNKGPGGFPDPADGLFQDWFELFNPNTNAVNLSGLYLTDNLSVPAKWRVPADTFISGHGFLLVWADNNTNQNPVLGGTNVDLHASFQLNNGGEAIGLFATDGLTPLSTVMFGPQVRNTSQGRFPDGDTNTRYFMANWTPHAANTLASLAPPHILSIAQSNNVVTLVCEVMAGRTYQLQFKNTLAEPVWFPAPLASAQRTVFPFLTLNDGFDITATNRFYRVVLLP